MPEQKVFPLEQATQNNIKNMPAPKFSEQALSIIKLLCLRINQKKS